MNIFEEMGIRELKPNEALEIRIDAEWLEDMKEGARKRNEEKITL